MKRSLFIIILFLSAVVCVSAQTESKLVLKENVPNIPAAGAKENKKDISVEDWDKLESALQLEDWTRTSDLAKEYLQKLDTETKDGKMARLRYIYLYALAGKVISYSFSNDRLAEDEARIRLKIATDNFVGKEFIFPVRKILADCKGSINYVCESKENPGFLRIAATNSTGTSIHFSEYVQMRFDFDVKRYDKVDVILGGKLKGFRLMPERTNKLLMVLQFENGYVEKIYTNEAKGKL